MSLLGNGKHADAEHMLQDVLASCHSVLGPAHPDTLQVARNLKLVRARRMYTCSVYHGCPFSDEDADVVVEHEKHCVAPQVGPHCNATAACTATAACSVGPPSPADDGDPGTPPPTPPSPSELEKRARLVRDMQRYLQAEPAPLPQFAAGWSRYMGAGAVFDKRNYTNNQHMKLRGLLESIPATVELYQAPGPNGNGRVWWACLL
jgi:hypothetical protein